MPAKPQKRGRRRPQRRPNLGAADMAVITKVLDWSWTSGRSKQLLLHVESAGHRLALTVSLPAALALEEAIGNAWVADYFL